MPAPDYQTEIDALESALASGELTVEENGARITYRSTSDIVAQIRYFKSRAQEFLAPRTRPGPSVAVAVFERA